MPASAKSLWFTAGKSKRSSRRMFKLRVCFSRCTRGRRALAKPGGKTHDFDMSTVTIALPDPLDAALLERMMAVGARSKEEYLLALIESDCAASELERVLVDRLAGPFEPLETDWKERVRQSATK
jgi:hypothetical protein